MNNLIVSMWEKNRLFYEASLSSLNSENYTNRLSTDTSSAGFLMLHTAESMLYCSMLLGYPVQLPELTTIASTDNGQGEDLSKVASTFRFALDTMSETVKSIQEEDLNTTIETFLGPITKVEFIAFVMHHTGYHIGQAAYAIKRGKAHAVTAQAA